MNQFAMNCLLCMHLLPRLSVLSSPLAPFWKYWASEKIFLRFAFVLNFTFLEGLPIETHPALEKS